MRKSRAEAAAAAARVSSTHWLKHLRTNAVPRLLRWRHRLLNQWWRCGGKPSRSVAFIEEHVQKEKNKINNKLICCYPWIAIIDWLLIFGLNLEQASLHNKGMAHILVCCWKSRGWNGSNQTEKCDHLNTITYCIALSTVWVCSPSDCMMFCGCFLFYFAFYLFILYSLGTVGANEWLLLSCGMFDRFDQFLFEK